MFAIKPGSAVPIAILFAALSTLSACGGSGDASSPKPPVAVDPAPPVSPSPPTTPAPPTTPPPTTPPSDPGPPQITLEKDFTQISATTGFSKDYWPAWSNDSGEAVDGVGCASGETYHIHALLSIYKDGQRLALPDSIGRNSHCNFEMHVHDGSGVVHIETDKPKGFTLGQFMALWGQPVGAGGFAGLPGKPTYYLIDNEKITPYSGEPAAIDLSAHREILVVTGAAPAQVPRYDWGNSGL